MPESQLKDVTLLFLIRDGQILLAMKKRGFGKNYWNGVGGKLDPGETIEQALVREAQEEIDVSVDRADCTKVAELDFYFPEGSESAKFNMRVHAYMTRSWQGEPAESEEMRPQWFAHDEIPFESMWADDPHWVPLVLAGKFVTGTFWFTEDNELIKHQLSSRLL